MEDNIYVLCSNNNKNGWVAIAVFFGYPSVVQILSLSNFSQRLETDRKIADILIKHSYCAIFYDNSDRVFEYNIFQPDAWGELNLHNYLLTGYSDLVSDEKKIII